MIIIINCFLLPHLNTKISPVGFPTGEIFNRHIPHSANYTLCLDLLPDGTWGKAMGMEVFQQLLNGKKQIIASYREELLRQFANWQLTDERTNLLGECEQLLLIPDPKTNKKKLISSYLSHFKLRWQDDKPLPAKAYFQICEF